MIPIRLNQEGAVQIALDVAQHGARKNLLDLKELRRQVMLNEKRLSQTNLPERAWTDAEMLITPRPPGINHNQACSAQIQTAVWLKYNNKDHYWYIHQIYRTKEPLPMKRIKIKQFNAEQAHKALTGIIEHRQGIEIDGLTIFAMF